MDILLDKDAWRRMGYLTTREIEFLDCASPPTGGLAVLLGDYKMAMVTALIPRIHPSVRVVSVEAWMKSELDQLFIDLKNHAAFVYGRCNFIQGSTTHSDLFADKSIHFIMGRKYMHSYWAEKLADGCQMFWGCP